MEFTREIYWNVGNSAMTLIPMYLLAIASFAILAWGIKKRIQFYKQGKELNRTDKLGARITQLIQGVLLQKKVIRVKGPGLAHALFFWSFLILFIGTIIVVIQADITNPIFGVKFLKGSFYKIFSLSLDIAGALAIVMLGGLFVRRYFIRPEGLNIKKDDALMHGLLFAILITGFIIEGARMAVTEMGMPVADWSPIGKLVAHTLSGFETEGLKSLHSFLWWFHMLLVAGFIASIPFTKFKHIYTTSANYLFENQGPVGKMTSLDMEDEEAESFGAVNVSDMRWKDIFDADACTECKRCQDRCPAHNTGKPLSPMKVVNTLGDVAFNDSDASLIEAIGKDAIWSCTTCRACEEICPASIEHVDKLMELRRSMVLMEGEFPGEEVMTAIDNIEVNGNPLGMAFASRGDWAEGLPVVTMAESKEVDVLYFVGCYASFDKRNQEIAKSFIKLCNAAGLKVGILGKEEKCCGEPARKMGNEYMFQMTAQENIETFKNYGVEKIVTTCPHCFNTLAKDYTDFDFEAEVVHYTTFLDELYAAGKLKFKSESLDCTYHDSCYLGRHNDIYSAPRNLLKAAGANIKEMDKNKSEAFCCSAGGGRILAEEKLGDRINIKRIEMAAATNSSNLISNCPFCLTMFEDGVKGADKEDSLKTRDIAEVLVERLEV